MILSRGKLYKTVFIFITSIFLSACSDSEAPAEKSKIAPSPAKASETTDTPITAMPAQDAPMQKQQAAPKVLENGVIYQEEIYKNWP